MVSGNFLIGMDLSLENFNRYVEPILEEKRCIVRDRLVVNYCPKIGSKTIFTSVVGNVDLGKMINQALIDSKEVISGEQGVWRSQVSINFLGSERGQYRTIGIYEENEEASRLFTSLVKKYL